MTALMRHFKSILSDDKAFASADREVKENIRRANTEVVQPTSKQCTPVDLCEREIRSVTVNTDVTSRG